MHNATPVHGELAGIAWLREWQFPYEGAYTLLLKFAVANGARAGELCEAVFGQRPNQAHTYGRLHARSLLDTHWIDQSGEKGIAAIRLLAVESALSARAGRWTSLIAADKSFRFCPECLQHGFQSFLYQIDAVVTCPIHGVPILAHCKKCGQPAPPYALSEAAFAVPFHCPSCLTPYSGNCDMSQWGNQRLYADAARRLAPIAKWVQSLAASTLLWREWHAWELPVQGLTNEEDKRRTTLQVLMAAIPPNFDVAALDLGRSRVRLYTGGFETVPSSSTLPQKRQEISPEICAERIQLYKAVRRHLRRAIAGCHRAAAAPLDAKIETHGVDGALILSRTECPRSQALALWRYHFEEMQSNPRSLDLRDAALQWPWNGVVNAGAWGGYLLGSFYAAVDAFNSWRDAAAILNDTSVTGNDRVRAKELHTMYAPIVTPKRQPNFPAVSFLTYVNGDTMPAVLVVGPTKSGGGASDVACGLWCPCQQAGDAIPELAESRLAPTPVEVTIMQKAAVRPLVRWEYFAPLDQIRLPPILDGSDVQAKLRAFGPCLTKAKNDLEAIQAWLQHYPHPKTRQNHEVQAQKVLVWCVAQRNIALSEMGCADVDAFTDFLAAPEPQDIWLPPKLIGKPRPWSPLRAAASPVTQDNVLNVIAVMFKCWRAWAYIMHEPFDNSKFAQRRAKKAFLRVAGELPQTENFLTVVEWRYLITAVPQYIRLPMPAVRFILCMAYYGALKLSEISCIKLGDLRLYRDGRAERDVWSVRIDSRAPRQEEVFLLAPVAQIIADAMPVERALVNKYLQKSHDNWLRHLFGIEYGGIATDSPELMGNRIGIAIKPVFYAAADLALDAGDEVAAQRLRQATMIWVTSSLWHHVPRSYVAGAVLWHVLGSKKLIEPEDRNYLPARIPFDQKNLHEQMVSLHKAIAH